jgi:hypothetical protein
MAFPLTLYMPVRQGFFRQMLIKIAYVGHWIKAKPTAKTGLIHFSRLILVPESVSNRGYASLFKRTKGFMLLTSFDGGMMPYFRAFWKDRKIRKTFNRLRLFALDPPPKLTGNEYNDYNNFQTWLMKQDIQTDGFYSAYPQTLSQILHQMEEKGN